MTFRTAAFRAALLASAATIPWTAGAQAVGSNQSGTGDVIRVLLDQSSYWRSKSETKLADEALNRVLALDPNNVDALAQQAQAAADRGDAKAANDALAKLRAARPDDPRIASIQQSLKIGPIDQAALADARKLGQDGKPNEALAAYRRVFKGDNPPPSLATEFYQTLGATEGNWEAARDGLAAHLRADPQDLPAQLAYAELLTYRDESRDDGVARLAYLTREAQVSAQADRAWHQALSWLPATQISVPKYDEYLAHNPTDPEVQRWRTIAMSDTGSLRAAGFDALEKGKLADADASFSKALTIDPKDSDTMIGLALVRNRQNRLADARELVRKAIEIDPGKAAQYQPMLEGGNAGGTNTANNNGGGYYGRNGGRGNVDYGAIAVRKIRGEYAQVASLTQKGEYAAAEALLRKLMGRRPNAGNYLQLGDIQMRAGHLGEAEQSFRTVLRSQPRNAVALSGLAGVLQRENKTAEADQVFQQAQAAGGGAAIGQNRAQSLRQQAEYVSDPVARTGLFRAAVAADPASPWLRLELARSLEGQGQDAEARQVMAPVIDAPRPSVDQLRAGIYFAVGNHQNRLASSLVSRLPANARTPEMQQIGTQADIASDEQDAKAQPTVGAMQARMLQLAQKPDPTGGRASAFATDLAKAGDKAGARDVIRAALSATPNPTPQQRIAYAGALVGAGYPRDAKVITAGLSGTGLNPLQRSNLSTVQDNAAVSAADVLNSRGQTTDALNELTPRLQRDPSNPALNMALARVYTAQQKPGQAVAITQELLKRNPGDMQVQVAAVSAALAAGQTDRAGELARKLTADYPDEPQGWFAAAQVARSRGDNGGALSDLRKARDLRRQQLTNEGTSDASDVEVPGWLPGRQYALNQPRDVMSDVSPEPTGPELVSRTYEQYAQNTAVVPSGLSSPVTFGDEPVGTPAASPATEQPPSVLTPPAPPVQAAPVQVVPQPYQAGRYDLDQLVSPPAASPLRSTSAPTPDEPSAAFGGVGNRPGTATRAPADQLTADIDRSIAQVSADIAPQVTGSLSVRGRSGSTGLSQLFDVEAPVEASFSPNGYGRLKVQVTPVGLYSGQPSSGNLALFGSNPLAVAQGTSISKSRTTAAGGAALDVSYAYNFVTVDVGSTPLGFEQSSVVGGVQFLPRIANNLYLRLTADRRIVTDSLLSYAGQTDGRTGQKWGGVTRNRLYGQIEGSVFGDTYYYAGAGFSSFSGENVAGNDDVEAGAGFTTPVFKTANGELRAGLNLVYFGFRRNLGNFTLGNGGYFSPQQFFSALIPVTWRQQLTPRLTYSVGASIGGQTFRAKGEKIFPHDDALQSALVTAAASNSTIATRYAGFSGTGIAGGARGDIDYRLTDNLHIGAQAGFDRSGTFTEGTGLVYARYTFNSPQPQ